ncbi:MAG: hypothetical protein LBP62_00495 [Clostridiales bacterium]|nr:hypothetical protein [Clostridiales bacterium]
MIELRPESVNGGKEFGAWDTLGIRGLYARQCIYAHAYRSFERGSGENFNGIVRRFAPKKKKFS